MVSPVTGFMSEDGHFFVSELEAKYHEAREDIKEACLTLNKPVNAESFLYILEAMADEVGEYVRAYKEVNKHKVAENPGRTRGDQSDDGRGSEDDDALEQFEVGGHEPLSDMGDSS